MGKYLKVYVGVVLVILFFFEGRYVRSEEASFYIDEKKEKKTTATFYIEEEKKWKVKIGTSVYATADMREVNIFIKEVNNWYKYNLFNGFPEEILPPEPPYIELNLGEIRDITGYQGEVLYFINQSFGVGFGYESYRGASKKPFEYHSIIEGEGGSQEVFVSGDIALDVFLSGPSFELIFKKAGLAKNLDASFYLGAGSYTARVRWGILESWEIMGDEPLLLENVWKISGEGNSTGYEAGIILFYPLKSDFFAFLDAGYRSIVIRNLNYKTLEEKSAEGWINEMVEKPVELDFSGIGGKIGIGFDL